MTRTDADNPINQSVRTVDLFDSLTGRKGV